VSDASAARQGFRYVLVAAGSAATDWMAFTALVWAGAWHVHAHAVSRIAGGLFSFVLNRTWSFDATHDSPWEQAIRFGALYIFSFVLSIAVLYGLADVLGVSPYASKLVADATCFAVNFMLMRGWVFRAGRAYSAEISQDSPS
jgi:putative flippase GtrA